MKSQSQRGAKSSSEAINAHEKLLAHPRVKVGQRTGSFAIVGARDPRTASPSPAAQIATHVLTRWQRRIGRVVISQGGKVIELLPGTPEHAAYVEKEIKRRKREAEPLRPQLTAPAASNPEMARDGHTGPYWDALRKLPRFKIGISSMKAFILPGYPPPMPTNPPDMKLRLQNIASIELSRIQPNQVQPFARLNEVAEAWGLDKVEVNRMARVRNPQSLQLPLTLSPR